MKKTNHKFSRSRKISISFNTVIFLLIFVICLFASTGISAGKDDEKIENTKAALEKWVETQKIISKEKRDFELAKEMLNERIGLVKREIKSLRKKISDAEDSIAEADKKRKELIEENEKLKKTSASLSDTLVSLEERTKDLLERLPGPIKDRVKPLSQRLPDDSDKTEKASAERFQNVVGILNEIDKFNGEVSATSEIRKLDDGSTIEVTAIYVGIGQAYYVSGNENTAGIGIAGEKKWEWKTKNEAAENIADAIAILNNEKPASFIQVPVEIH